MQKRFAHHNYVSPDVNASIGITRSSRVYFHARRRHPQEELFSYRTPEERIPDGYPIRKPRKVVDLPLKSMDEEVEPLYARTGRESVPPERLLRASLLQVLYTVRSERQLVQQIEFKRKVARWERAKDMTWLNSLRPFAILKVTLHVAQKVEGSAIDA